MSRIFGRSVNFLNDPPSTILVSYINCDITTRFFPTPIIKESPFENLTWFTGTTINDIFQSKSLFFTEPGTYDMSIECETGPMNGNMVFYLDGQIIGAHDFYSKYPNFTIRYIEGIQVDVARKYKLTGLIDTKNPNSSGYNIAMANLKIIKRV